MANKTPEGEAAANQLRKSRSRANTPSAGPPKESSWLWELLKESIKSVPVNKYALGVVGLAAAVGIVLLILKDREVAVLGIAIMAGMMVIIMLLGWIKQHGGKTAQWVVPPIIIFIALMFCATILMVFIQFFFNWPKRS